MTTYPEVASLIPHRSSMALLERVVFADEETLHAEVLIGADCIFFDAVGHGVPAWLGIEYMAQAIAAFEGYWSLQRGEPVKVGLLLGSRRYESHCAQFAAGSVLRVEVHRVLQHENGLGAFDCRKRAGQCHRDGVQTRQCAGFFEKQCSSAGKKR